MLSELDEQGVHTVRTVLTIEHNRCSNPDANEAVKAYNGISFASKQIPKSEDNEP